MKIFVSIVMVLMFNLQGCNDNAANETKQIDKENGKQKNVMGDPKRPLSPKGSSIGGL
ncbi:MAG: hypothetical protein Q8L93_02625 [Rhodocyclaceae bacterium]|nr:hypothetical protein [Rhodocyclaceae bacterium]